MRAAGLGLAVLLLGAAPAVAADKGPYDGLSLTMSVAMGEKEFTACAIIANHGTRPRLITAPFSFRISSELFIGFWTPDGRSATLNKDMHPSSSPVPFYAEDRLNFDVIDPAESITACKQVSYSEFEEKVVDSDIVFTPWLQPWMKLPFDAEFLEMMGPVPTDHTPLTTNVCRIDIEKHVADCAIAGLKEPAYVRP